MTCANCGAALVGRYCHECGQRRIAGRLTLGEFLADVVRRVLRFDRALLTTFGRALYQPGILAEDYLAGRRQKILDPIHYFVSAIFMQLLAGAVTRALAPVLDRESALNWLGTIGGIVAIRIIVVFWMGGLWRLLFRPIRHNIAESLSFSFYAFGTIGLIWALLPLIDLAVPMALGANAMAVILVCFGLELVYLTFGVRSFSGLSLWAALWRVALVLSLGYSTLYLLAGLVGMTDLLLPPLPAS